jgi:hypothetical protein
MEGIAELKRVLARRAPALPERGCLETGLVDELLGGGFPRGRVAEVAGARSSGKAALVLAAAARATACGRLVAWIDAHRELYPPAAAALGVDLDRLLVVRPARGTSMALAAARAAEIVAQSRAFVLIVVDLGAAKLEGTPAARLRQATHEAEAATVLLLGPQASSTCATVRLEVSPRQAVLARGGAAPPGTRTALTWLSPFHPPQWRAALSAAGPARTMRARQP